MHNNVLSQTTYLGIMTLFKNVLKLDLLCFKNINQMNKATATKSNMVRRIVKLFR